VLSIFACVCVVEGGRMTTDGFNFAKDPLVTLAELYAAVLRCMLVCNNKL